MRRRFLINVVLFALGLVVAGCTYVYEEVTTGIVAGELKKRLTDRRVAQPCAK